MLRTAEKQDRRAAVLTPQAARADLHGPPGFSSERECSFYRVSHRILVIFRYSYPTRHFNPYIPPPPPINSLRWHLGTGETGLLM